MSQTVQIKSDRTIATLPSTDKRLEHPDDRITGLYLVQQPSGGLSWALRYRYGGQPRKLTIGPFPAVDLKAARRRAQEAVGAIAGGNDPASAKAAAKAAARDAKRQDSVGRVAAVVDSFLDRYVRRNVGASWAKETERLLRVEVIPEIGEKRITDVGRADIHGLLDGMVDRGSAVNANRLLAVLRRMFNWCVERDLIEHSPCDKLKAPTPETARARVLTDAETRTAWGAFDRIGWPFGRIAQLLLLTGARRDEIAGAKWADVDLETKIWTVPAYRSKNGQAHTIPLSDAAISIIDGLPHVGRAGFVFTTNERTAVSGWSRAKNTVDKAIGEMTKGQAMPHWTFHDLRRTCASGMAALGVPPHVVEAALNHRGGAIKGVAAVYNRYAYDPEKREALDIWAKHVEEIVR
jgi:integrase